MKRSLLSVLLMVVCVVFLGCAEGEPLVQDLAPISVEPAEVLPEPNEPGEMESPAVPETDEAVPRPDEGQARGVTAEPAETIPAAEAQADAAPEPAEANEPPVERVPDSNDQAPPPDGGAEPNAVAETLPIAQVVLSESDLPAEEETPEIAPSPWSEPYAAILTTYVRENGLVDYGNLRRRRLDLRPILTDLDELDPNVYEAWSRQEKLAFWINAYNLKMLDIIARNYPIESSWWLRLTWPPSDIRHIDGIWTDYKFIVMDEEFTLAEVERRFFRRTFEDPRIYLAITYASQSSPPLRLRPYEGADLDRQLDEQVGRFLASPQGLQIDRRGKVVRLSALFKPGWRGREFVARYGTDKKFKDRVPETRAVLSFLTNYLPAEDVEFLEVENYAIEYINFDWRLNDTSRGY